MRTSPTTCAKFDVAASVVSRSGLTVVSGPTAVGKGTVVSRLSAEHPQIFVSVSATSSFGGTVLYSTNGTTWSTTPPATVATGGTVYVGVNNAAPNTAIDTNDTVPANGVSAPSSGCSTGY